MTAFPELLRSSAAFQAITALWLLETGILCLLLAKRIARRKRRNAPDLANVLCHDLSTPLSIVLSLAEPRAEAGDAAWIKVRAAARRQRTLIEHVRTMQALDHGKIRAVIEPTRVREMVQRLIEDHEQRMIEKNLGLDFEAEPAAREALALVDPVLFEETVLGNLLANAIKFSNPGTRVSIQAFAEDERIEFRIRDRGIGIPEPQLKALFKNGRKLSRPGTRGEKGSGLGLQLAWAATAAMKGRIELRDASPGIEARVSVPRARGH